MSKVLNLKKEEAELMLERFLKENPDMRERQAELSIKLESLSHEDRMVFLSQEMKSQLEALNKELRSLNKTLEGLN